MMGTHRIRLKIHYDDAGFIMLAKKGEQRKLMKRAPEKMLLAIWENPFQEGTSSQDGVKEEPQGKEAKWRYKGKS